MYLKLLVVIFEAPTLLIEDVSDMILRHDTDTSDYVELCQFSRIIFGVNVSVSLLCVLYVYVLHRLQCSSFSLSISCLCQFYETGFEL